MDTPIGLYSGGIAMTDYTILTVLLVFTSGVVAGVINSLAGGGSVITIATLTAIGVPPLIANSTNTVATIVGYLSGAHRLKNHLDYTTIWKLAPIAVVGGILGAFLLKATPAPLFAQIIPYLLLFASLLFMFGSDLRNPNRVWTVIAVPLISLVMLYGGYFQAGLGILLIPCLLQLKPQWSFAQITAMKLVLSTLNALAASTVLVHAELINWEIAVLLMVGLALGGQWGARWTVTISATRLKFIIFGICLCVTVPLFFI